MGRTATRTHRHRGGEIGAAAAAKKALSHRQAAAFDRRRGHRWRARGSTARNGFALQSRIDWPRTLRTKGAARLARDHLRHRPQQGRAGALHCFVLDCSGSMLAGERLALAKGALLALFARAYQQRAEVALICFAGDRAELRLAPTAARRWHDDWIRPIAGGGGTPLRLGIDRAAALLADRARRQPAQQRWLWLLSDGRSDETPQCPAAAEITAIVDFEHPRQGPALGRCRMLAERWRADYHRADDLIRA